jgi:hypothetical protein
MGDAKENPCELDTVLTLSGKIGHKYLTFWSNNIKIGHTV